MLLAISIVALSIGMYFIIPWLDTPVNKKSYRENFILILMWDYQIVLDKIKFLWNEYKNKKGGW